MENDVKEIVKATIREQEMTLRQMAQALGVSHPTIINWRTGRTEPETDFLLRLRGEYQDWRKEFAEGILKNRLPGLFNDSNLH